MTTDSPAKSPKPGRGFLLASLVFFVIFAANIVWGKIAITQGATTTPGLGDVGEFLTLFVAVVLFIAACLARERAEQTDTKNTQETS